MTGKSILFNHKTLALLCGLVAIGVGLPYVFKAFGPSEHILVTWGKSTVLIGAALLLGSLLIKEKISRIQKLILALVCSGLAIMQVPPIILWFVFHGSGIDEYNQSNFVAHWGYALPHAVLFLICVLTLYSLLSWKIPWFEGLKKSRYNNNSEK